MTAFSARVSSRHRALFGRGRGNLPVGWVFLICLFFSSCSAPSSHQEDNSSSTDSSAANTSSTSTAPDTAPHPSEGLKKFIDVAIKDGFQLKGRIHASEQKNFFGLIDPSQTFSYLETGILAKTPNACLTLSKNGQTFEVEEWSFASLSEAGLVEHALTAPVKDGTERFVRTPFTYWRVKERMHYLSTSSDKARPGMDQLNNKLVLEVEMRTEPSPN